MSPATGRLALAASDTDPYSFSESRTAIRCLWPGFWSRSWRRARSRVTARLAHIPPSANKDGRTLKNALGLLRRMIYGGGKKIRTGRTNDSVTRNRLRPGVEGIALPEPHATIGF